MCSWFLIYAEGREPCSMTIQKKQPNRGGRFRRWVALTLALCLLSALAPRGFGGVAKAATTTASVTCYAAVDGGWKEVNALTTDKSASYRKWKTMVLTKERYYLTATEVEAAYAAFGFKAAELNEDSRIFPHTDASDEPNLLWADVTPQKVSAAGAGGFYVPLCYDKTLSTHPIYLYYLPNNKPDNSAYFDGSANKDNADILAQNMFYSLEVRDPENIIRRRTACCLTT